MPGGVDESYGIDVARLAGIPNKVISRAKEFLLEMEDHSNSSKALSDKDETQISFSALNHEVVIDRLRKINVDELTDEECREFIEDLMKLI